MAVSNRAKGGVAIGSAALIVATLVGIYEPGANVHKPYLDTLARPAIWTVCEGHTGNVDPKRIYTDAECKAFKMADIARAQAEVRRCLPMPLLPQIEGAITDAAYNIGPSVVCGSTLQRKALANDWPGVCAELSRWDHAGGRVLPGLTRRRTNDREICEGKAVLDMWAKP